MRTAGFEEQRECLKSWRTAPIVGGIGSHKPQKHMLPPGCLLYAAMQLCCEVHVQLGGIAD